MRPLLALLILCSACVFAHGQSLAHRAPANSQTISDAGLNQGNAARAIFLLKRLDDDVIVYRSLGAFEESGKLARVPFEAFQKDLFAVSSEVRAIAATMPAGRVKTDIFNALASYRDGAFYWQQVYRPRVINVASFREEPNSSPAETFFQANTSYTVAIYWRQANKFLQRAAQDAAGL
jgi:hypothetical protein